MTKAPIALTCGEPAGIGPELAESAWQALRTELPFYLIGDPAHLPGTVPSRVIDAPSDAAQVCAEALPVWPLAFDGPRSPGIAQPAQAQGVIDAIAQGVAHARQGLAAGLCTLPIHKHALATGADFAYPGHTEYLAALCGVRDVVMMLASPDMRVVPATIHIALDQVPQVLSADLLERQIRITHQDMARFGIATPRIAVAGLNPHAGEGGRMGLQEQQLITPVIAKLRAEGMDLRGPLPADTMFHARARASYDVAICMYHDQALIPIKTLDFDRGVNVTLGLPIIRTSPDHGTAFDIAGKGLANPTSTIEALRLAHDMAAKAAPQRANDAARPQPA